MNRAIERIVQDIGPIDVLVNNAGIERVGAVADVPMDDIRAVMEADCFGAVRCIKAVAPSMRERRRGCIVNVTSISGRIAASPMGPDEEWVASGALDDDAWYAAVQADFGLDACQDS